MKLVVVLHPGTESYSLPILKHGGLFNSPFWDLNSRRGADSRTWVPRAYIPGEKFNVEIYIFLKTANDEITIFRLVVWCF